MSTVSVPAMLRMYSGDHFDRSTLCAPTAVGVSETARLNDRALASSQRLIAIRESFIAFFLPDGSARDRPRPDCTDSAACRYTSQTEFYLSTPDGSYTISLRLAHDWAWRSRETRLTMWPMGVKATIEAPAGEAFEPPGWVYERLRDEITSGRIGPNERLKVAELAARYGTSTNPIREALQLLRGEGFVIDRAEPRRPRPADRRELRARHHRDRGADRAGADALVRLDRRSRRHRAAGGGPGRDRGARLRRPRPARRSSTPASTRSSTTATTTGTRPSCGGSTARSCARSAAASRRRSAAARR